MSAEPHPLTLDQTAAQVSAPLGESQAVQLSQVTPDEPTEPTEQDDPNVRLGQDTLDFLRTLLGPEDGSWFGLSWIDHKGRFRSAANQELKKLVLAARRLEAKGATSLYWRCCPMDHEPPEGKRGEADDSSRIGYLWADVDFGSEGHKDLKCPIDCGFPLPPDAESAAKVWGAAGLPDPTITVNSGGGLYPLWVLDESLPIDDDNRETVTDVGARWDAQLQAGAHSLGFHHSTGTGSSDLARVLRMPGSLNKKTDNVRTAVILSNDGPRYTWGGVSEALLDAALVVTPAPVAKPQPRREALDDDDRAFLDAAERVSGSPLDVLKHDVGIEGVLLAAEWDVCDGSHGSDIEQCFTRPGGGSTTNCSAHTLVANPHVLVTWSADAGLPTGGGQKLTAARLLAHFAHGSTDDDAVRAVARDIRDLWNGGGSEAVRALVEHGMPTDDPRDEMELSLLSQHQTAPQVSAPPRESAAGQVSQAAAEPRVKVDLDSLSKGAAKILLGRRDAADAHEIAAQLGYLQRSEKVRLQARAEAEEALAAEAAIVEDDSELYLDRDQLDDLPHPEALIDGVLPRHAYGLITGRDGTFKTFVALDWALHIATGGEWHGREVQAAPVLYIAGEGFYGFPARIAAWEETHNGGGRVPAEMFRVRGAALNLHTPGPSFDRLLDHVAEGGYGLVVGDTLNRLSGGADGNGSDMSAVVNNLIRIKEATEHGTVLVVAHTGKTDDDTRGFSGIEDDSDFVWNTKRSGDEVTLHNTKMKDAAEQGAMVLRAEQVLDSMALVAAGRPAPELPTDLRILGYLTSVDKLEPQSVSDVFAGAGIAPRSRHGYKVLNDLVYSGQVLKMVHTAGRWVAEDPADVDPDKPTKRGRYVLPA